MKVAVVGSRNLQVDDLENYLPENVTEIISGGAKGVDTCAKEYALAHRIRLTEYLPEYSRYGRSAPLRRNITIIEQADLVLAFWDGVSRGTKYVIDNCRRRGIPVKVFLPRGSKIPGRSAGGSGTQQQQVSWSCIDIINFTEIP